MIQWKKIRAVIFDLDGTLVDSLEIWQEIDEEFFARRNQPVPCGYQQNIAHLGLRECAAFTVREYLPQEREESLVEEWRNAAREKYADKDSAKYFKPHALEFVHRLSEAGKYLCVATASSPDLYLPVLQSGGISELFDVFATVDCVGKNKSYPDIYQYCARQLGVEPSECVVFEDNLTALRSAKKAGMQTVAVADGQTVDIHNCLKKEADEFVVDFGQFLQVKF